MSFLEGRLAATEGSYFFQESKQAVTRLAQKKPNNLSSSPSPSSVTEPQPDVFHEILWHSLPTKIFEPLSDSSLSTGSTWVLPHGPTKVSSISSDAQNPLRAYVSLPQVSFGPKRRECTKRLAALAVVGYGLYSLLSPKKKMMVAPGTNRAQHIPREAFVKAPKDYFRSLRNKE